MNLSTKEISPSLARAPEQRQPFEWMHEHKSEVLLNSQWRASTSASCTVHATADVVLSLNKTDLIKIVVEYKPERIKRIFEDDVFM